MDKPIKRVPILVEPFLQRHVTVRLRDAHPRVVALYERPSGSGSPDPTRHVGIRVEQREHGLLQVGDREALYGLGGEEVNGSDIVELHEQVHVAELVRTVLVASRGGGNHRRNPRAENGSFEIAQ